MDISSLPAQVMNCGHEACKENIYRIKVKKGKSYYGCRKCRNIRDRERYNRRKAFRFELHCKCGCVTKASVPQETLGEHQGYSVRGMTLHCGTCGYSAYVKEVDGK